MFIKKHSKKLMMLAATGIVAFPLAVNAASTTIDATARFLQTITLNNAVTMDFGTVEYSATPGGADTVVMSTDGSLTAAGVFTSSATGTAGSVDIATGTAGETLDFYCSTSAVLAEAGGATIAVTSIRIADTDTAAGGGSACAGDQVGGGTVAMSYVMGSGTDQIKLGGTLDGGVTTGTWTDGVYAATTAGGTPITVDVVYQ
ncbi:MAG: DUF4402 domain-containing protein [Alphaproteobacteria bacterium]|nr:MAG: DUF4402 domain-containing protein [Alphaproteobacteria bacterium]